MRSKSAPAILSVGSSDSICRRKFYCSQPGWLVFDEWRDGCRHEAASTGKCSRPSPRVAILKFEKACNGSGGFLDAFFIADDKKASRQPDEPGYILR
jgi:hypothetical protein